MSNWISAGTCWTLGFIMAGLENRKRAVGALVIIDVLEIKRLFIKTKEGGNQAALHILSQCSRDFPLMVRALNQRLLHRWSVFVSWMSE